MVAHMERKPRAKVGPRDSGTRLLAWLSARFTYLSTEAWLRMLCEGRVSVDGRPAPADRILARGETVAFDPPPYKEPEVDAVFSPVLEDEDFLIIDKSGNLPCHPGGRYFENSLLLLLRASYGDIRIATRLDRETSGLVLACKSVAAAAYAQGMLAEGAVEKSYLAMVHGRFPDRLEATGRLTVDSASAVRKKRRYLEGSLDPNEGKAEFCSSSFERVDYLDRSQSYPECGPLSLVLARPITGRTHQIRATLCSLGFPLVGDKLYGPDERLFLRFVAGALSEEDLTRLMLPNQALHCRSLSFKNRAGRVISAASSPRWGPPYTEILAQLP
jgi:RluA family pseudouridine synthase